LSALAGYVLCCTPALAQQVTPDPKELVRQAVANELASPFVTENCTYQYHRIVSGKQETRLMIKSSDLVVGKLVRVGTAPVSHDEETREDQRLRSLLENPLEQDRERKRQRKLESDLRALLGAMPEAFRYTQTQTEMDPQHRLLVHVAFQPAPDFKPASLDQEVLRGMMGTMVIDDAGKQIVRVEAQLFRNVDFGWGVLMHLYKGGTLLLDRDPAAQAASNIRVFALNVNGRILLLKQLEIRWSFDHFACFHHDLSLASAIAMLTSSNVAQLSPQ
jgi:hypothetical protein